MAPRDRLKRTLVIGATVVPVFVAVAVAAAGSSSFSSFVATTSSASNVWSARWITVDARWTAGGWITISGKAPPGSQVKTASTSEDGWLDPEDGAVRADADGYYVLRTKRLVGDEVGVRAFDPTTAQAISDGRTAIPKVTVNLAQWNMEKDEKQASVHVTGFAPPGSRVTTKDPTRGWLPREGKTILAKADGSFSLRTGLLNDHRVILRAYSQDGTVVAEAVEQLPAVKIVSAEWTTLRGKPRILVKGFAPPSTRVNAVCGPACRQRPIESGPARADSTGVFWLLGGPGVDHRVYVKAFSINGERVIADVDGRLPSVKIVSATRDVKGQVEVTGNAPPNSRVRVSGNAAVSWADPTNGTVIAGDDTWFSFTTSLFSHGEVIVKAFTVDGQSPVSEASSRIPDPKTGEKLAPVDIQLARWDAHGQVKVTGSAPPLSRVRVPKDRAAASWQDPLGGTVIADEGGNFGLTTTSVIDGKVMVKAFSADGLTPVSETGVRMPEIKITSANADEQGRIEVTGYAPPDSRIKNTDNMDRGWFDPEGGIVYADAEGTFSFATYRRFGGSVAVAAFSGDGKIQVAEYGKRYATKAMPSAWWGTAHSPVPLAVAYTFGEEPSYSSWTSTSEVALGHGPAVVVSGSIMPSIRMGDLMDVAPINDAAVHSAKHAANAAGRSAKSGVEVIHGRGVRRLPVL